MARATANPRDRWGKGSTWTKGGTIWGFAVGSVLGLLLLASGFFLLLGAWRVSVAAWVCQLGIAAASLWFAVRGHTRWATIASIVGLVGTLALGMFFAPAWRSMARHDSRERAIAAYVCAREQLPVGSVLDSCDSWITNPTNGNQCGYFVALRLRTAATSEQLEAFYSATPPAERFGDHLFRADPRVAIEDSGEQARVEVLLIGDEDNDPRCL